MSDYLYRKIGKKNYGKTKSIKLAQELLNNKMTYDKVVPWENGYFVPEHQTKILTKQNEASDEQKEKQTFRQAVIDNYKKYAIDYEINICPGEKQNIDVLFLFDGSIWMGECKGPAASGNEPLLRAVLEIETYSQIIDQKKLIEDYTDKLNWLKTAIERNNKIRKCIIVFEKKDGKESPMHRQLYQAEYKPIWLLMRKLKIYALKAESFCANPGKIIFFEGFSPSDY